MDDFSPAAWGSPTMRAAAGDPRRRGLVALPDRWDLHEAARRPDRLVRGLEWALVFLVVALPLPFGSVTAPGRLFLEWSAVAVGALWVVRAWRLGTPLPPRPVLAGMAGLFLLGLLQAAPWPETFVAWLSPATHRIHELAVPPPEVLRVEAEALGIDPEALERPAALSVSPAETASALRTGLALGVLLLAGATVSGVCGLRRLAVALVISGAFQALYGVLVLASGHNMIWNVPKRAYIHSATGTFVNRNHFAGFLELALPPGLALVMSRLRRSRSGASWRERFLALFTAETNQALLLGVLTLLGLTGLLLSFSRAGTALGLLAVVLTVLAGGRRGLRGRFVGLLLVVLVAVVPLVQVGADYLAFRYSQSVENLLGPGSRATVWADTLRLFLDFPFLGSGFGTFGTVYPLYRSPEVRLYYAHAHNDVLQFLAEGGLVGVGCMLLVLVPLMRRVITAFRGVWGSTAVGFAAGLAAFLLHGLVDFNFHIPSNAAVAAIVAGCLLGLPWRPRRS